MKITIMGIGAYSLAIGTMLLKNKENDITYWSHDQKIIDEFKKTGKFEKILPNAQIPKTVKFTTDYQVAAQADIIFFLVAAQFLDSVALNLKPYYKPNTHISIGSKGIEIKTSRFADQIVRKHLKTKRLSIISGPSFAVDLANNEPVGLAIASDNKSSIKVIKKVLENDTLKLRETSDMLGIEICGSIKNVIAIAAGIINGLGYKESTQAFLINESVHDIKELINKLGGNKNTILSFAGIGDLVLTCSSTKSRNYSFGVLVGKGNKKDINEYLSNTTVEGYYTISSIYNLLKNKKVKMPIIDLIYKIVLEGENPHLLIDFLINKK